MEYVLGLLNGVAVAGAVFAWMYAKDAKGNMKVAERYAEASQKYREAAEQWREAREANRKAKQMLALTEETVAADPRRN